MLLPRMLLFRPPRGGFVPRRALQERIRKFNDSQWTVLIEASLECAANGKTNRCRRRRYQKDTVERRAARAFGLAQVGELSSARQALEGATVAVGKEATRKMLTNTAKRPPIPREPLDEDIQYNGAWVCPFKNLRTSRRGAAAGPSGVTNEPLSDMVGTWRVWRVLGRSRHSFCPRQHPRRSRASCQVGQVDSVGET